MSIPVAAWSGGLRIGHLVLHCHVLDNGKRIIEEESVIAFMAWLTDPATPTADLGRFSVEYATWMRGEGMRR